MSVNIFFCYAREDEALLNKLKTHLRPLQRQGLINVWHDRDISAGTEWEKEINEHLNAAQLVLLLMSPDFMDSDYCYSIEMKRAIERHNRGEAKVIPIILRPVYWQGKPLGKLQALPTDGKPVTSAAWHDLDSALYDVTTGIHKVITQLIASPTFASPTVTDERQKEVAKLSVVVPEVQQVGSISTQQTINQWLKEGDALSALKRYEEALAAYEQAIRLNPNDAYAYSRKGDTLRSLNRYEEALSAYEQALRFNLGYVYDYCQVGDDFRVLKRYEEALAVYEQAIRLDPDYAYAYTRKGNILKDLKRYEEAEQAYAKARQLSESQ